MAFPKPRPIEDFVQGQTESDTQIEQLCDLLFPGCDEDTFVSLIRDEKLRRIRLGKLRAASDEATAGLMLMPAIDPLDVRRATAGAMLVVARDLDRLIRLGLRHPTTPMSGWLMDADDRFWGVWTLTGMTDAGMVEVAAGAWSEYLSPKGDGVGFAGVTLAGRDAHALELPHDGYPHLRVNAAAQGRQYTLDELLDPGSDRRRLERLAYHLDDRWARAEAVRREQEAALPDMPPDSWEELDERYRDNAQDLGRRRHTGG